MTDKIKKFQDDISAMNDNAEHILKFAEDHTNPDTKQTLTGIALTIKGQTVLAEMLLEVLNSQKLTP